MNARLCIVLAALGLAACGEPDYVPKGTTVSGDFNGVTFKNPHALFDSSEGFLGQNSAMVFISDHPNACTQIQAQASGRRGRSEVFDDEGSRMPSLVIAVPAQSSLSNHRKEGHIIWMDPGCARDAGVDDAGVSVCTPPTATQDSVIWVYETDSVRSDRNPHVRARFDATFDGGQRLSGAFLADPCAGVSQGCSMDPTALFALGGIATLVALNRRRRS